tara:strand:- start:985 stop:1671 length:687 start_codon:yes stop_codon:yes gene_type:complete
MKMEKLMMQISDDTMDVLKNFSGINPSLSFKAGNTIRTVSEQKNILAEATIGETLPVSFAIYELNQFLGLASLYDKPDFNFGEKEVTLSEGNNKSRYTYTDPSMVTSAPDKNLELDNADVNTKVTADDMKQIISAANQLGLPEIVFRGADGTLSLVATDTKNPTSNEHSISLGSSNNNYQMVFKTENLQKLGASDYDVSISKAGISHFKSTAKNLQYWIATETNSTFS